MSRKSNHIPFEITERFEIDTNSPTGLRWKNPTSMRGISRRNDKELIGIAGAYNNQTGYYQVKITDDGYKNFFVYNHRIVWMIANGKEIPEGYVVDHKQGKSNHPDNLRLATSAQNCANAKIKPRKSGLPNRIYKNKQGHFAKFCFNGETYKSPYGTIEESQEWLDKTIRKVHGEFFYDETN